MRLRALAKINLGLDILRKREDGYHEVRMIMQTIQMYDVLEMKRVRKPGISLSVNYSYIPNDERNLVYNCLLYTSPSPRDGLLSRMPSSA